MMHRPLANFSMFNEKKSVSEANSDIGSGTQVMDRLPKQAVWFFAFAIALTLAFGRPLLEMLRYSFDTGLHSHAILIPLITAYLIWSRRKQPLPVPASSPVLAVVPLAVGLVALKAVLFPDAEMAAAKPNDYLALTTFGYVSLLWAGALLFLGGRFLRGFAFPAAFLVFMVPMPTVVENAVEVFFQHTSADATAVLFSLSGMTYYREGLVFELPGIALQVAQECSGIRSSLVLIITSLLAGHLFLQTPQRRWVLTLCVIPLAIVRNAFRIVTIGFLCVHVDPAMIDSWIHRRGGPLFFALSLIPFFLLLFWLCRNERRRGHPKPSGNQGST
jgi:exosortase C (VPDSG-CTERM-specific)